MKPLTFSLEDKVGVLATIMTLLLQSQLTQDLEISNTTFQPGISSLVLAEAFSIKLWAQSAV